MTVNPRALLVTVAYGLVLAVALRAFSRDEIGRLSMIVGATALIGMVAATLYAAARPGRATAARVFERWMMAIVNHL
jgi:hypothetical protein